MDCPACGVAMALVSLAPLQPLNRAQPAAPVRIAWRCETPQCPGLAPVPPEERFSAPGG